MPNQATHDGHKDQQKQSETRRGPSENTGQGTRNTGNFKNDPNRAAEAGRKGGEHSHSGNKT